MKFRTAFTGLALLSSLLASTAGAQVRFAAVERATVEQRLKVAPKDNPARKQQLETMFQDAGCKGEALTLQNVSRSNLPNVICTLPGKTNSIILVGAHYDNEGSGAGIVDNWSGASLLPSLYESLALEPREHTYRFIGFTDEEKGLIGSEFYARRLSSDERANIHAMINIDVIGLSPPSVWRSRSDKNLSYLLLSIAKGLNIPLAAVNFEQVGSTDSESFRKRSIPALTIHSVTDSTVSIIHTSRDTYSAIVFDEYYRTYILVLGYLTFIDTQLMGTSTGSNFKANVNKDLCTTCPRVH